MGKGSAQRPTNYDKFAENHDRIFKKTGADKMVYLVETPHDIFWSRKKMDAQYKHVEYFWKDRAKYKEMTQTKFDNYCKLKSKKQIWEITHD